MLLRVLQVDVRLFLGTLGFTLPVAANFVVDEVVGGEVGPLGVRIFLADLLHVVFFHLVAHVWITLASRRTRESLFALQLPADVGCAKHGLRRVG